MSATQTTAIVPSSTQGPMVRNCIIASAVGTRTMQPTSEASIGLDKAHLPRSHSGTTKIQNKPLKT